MKFNTSKVRGILMGSLLVAMAMIATPTFAQDKGGQAKSKGGGQAKSSGARKQTSKTRSVKSGRTAQHTTTRTASTTRSKSTARTGNNAHSGNAGRTQSTARAMRMQVGRPMSAGNWRSSNPSWNGGYFYHNGGYYFDSGFSYPAIMVNEWGALALLGGGMAIAGALDNDPTLFFAGSVGALYSYSQYQIDLHSPDASIRLRAAYFGKPYFWRDGVRYDRITVTVGGVNNYQFRRH